MPGIHITAKAGGCGGITSKHLQNYEEKSTNPAEYLTNTVWYLYKKVLKSVWNTNIICSKSSLLQK